jgi:hypothetical protein
MQARQRRAWGRRLGLRDKSLVLLRQQEKVRLSKEICSVEADKSNLAWSRLAIGEDLGFHWFDDDEEWANNFWEVHDRQEQERVQKEHLDRFEALLAEVQVEAEAGAGRSLLETISGLFWKRFRARVGNDFGSLLETIFSLETIPGLFWKRLKTISGSGWKHLLHQFLTPLFFDLAHYKRESTLNVSKIPALL